MLGKEKSASSGVLSWLIAAAKIKSNNSSVQSGRRKWCSWAGHNFGALRNRDLTSELSGEDPLLLLCWNGCDCGRGICSSNLGDVFIFLWCVSADSYGADHFAFKLDWNAALQRSGAGQRERRDPPVAHLILKDFARPPENSRGPRLSDADFHACDLRVVEALEEQEMSAVIHHYDHDS